MGSPEEENNVEFKTQLLDLDKTSWEAIGKQIAEIEKQCFGDESYSEERLLEHAQNPHVVFVLLMDSAENVIGFSYALPDLKDINKETALIMTTDIHPDFQNRRLVGRIMTLMEKELRRRKFKFMTRHSSVDNRYAEKIQKHYGSRILETRERDSRFGRQRFFKIRL